MVWAFFFFQAEDGIRDLVRSRGLGDVYKRQAQGPGDVTRSEDGTAVGVEGLSGGHDAVGARHDADLLPCLTGQVVKGCLLVREPLYGVRGRAPDEVRVPDTRSG